MRDIAIAIRLEAVYRLWEFYSPTLSRRDWLRSVDGQWTVDQFDRLCPQHWVLPDPRVAA